MNIKKHTSAWVKEGFIRESQALSIIEFEEKASQTSWAMYGVAGIGITVMMTGIVSIIAANWNELSSNFKLFSYFGVLVVIALLNFKFELKQGLLRELLLTAYSFFLLAGIGLVGQLYNLNSESYRAFLFWIILIIPLTLISKRRLLPHIWFFGFYFTLALWNSQFFYKYFNNNLLLCLGAVYLSLAASYGLSSLVPENFSRTCRNWAVFVVLLGGGIYANTIWRHGKLTFQENEVSSINLLFVITSLFTCCLAIYFKRKEFPKRVPQFLILSIISSGVLLIPPLACDLEDSPIIGCVLFLIPWVFVAIAAVLGDRKNLFDAAALIIGARFVFMYFEVFGNLTATGFGLILSGAVILFTVFCWHKYRKQLAVLIREQI